MCSVVVVGAHVQPRAHGSIVTGVSPGGSRFAGHIAWRRYLARRDASALETLTSTLRHVGAGPTGTRGIATILRLWTGRRPGADSG
jgi:hypothetical protein